MADVASTLRQWSSTSSSNLPGGTTTIGSGLAPNLQQIQATVRQYLASKGSNIASAATTDLSTADGFFIDVTGTTTITSFGTESAGISYLLRFNGALTLTHNATSLILPGAANITTASGDVCLMISLGSGNWQCAFYSKANGAALFGSQFGQCILELSGGNLVLNRRDGKALFINGAFYDIPGAGVSLSASGATPSTLYYIYAYMNAGTMTLERSTTARATDSTYGHQIKSGDSTRTFVGWAYAVTGPAWANSASQRLVRSYFNDSGIVGTKALPSNASIGSSPWIEASSSCRVEFISVSGEKIHASARASWADSGGSVYGYTNVGLDGIGNIGQSGGYGYVANTSDVAHSTAEGDFTGASEGYHYVTLVGGISGGTSPFMAQTYSGVGVKTVR